MWVVMITSAPIAIGALFMEETSKARILHLKEKKLKTVAPHQTGDTMLLLQKLKQAFIRPLHMMLIEASTTVASFPISPCSFPNPEANPSSQ